MKRRATVRTMLVTAGLVALAGCATTRGVMGSGDPIDDRQRLMKNVGANWGDIQNKAKAGNIEAIAVNAEALALHSLRIPSLFPEGTLSPAKSAAKPEIWQKWPEFEAAAKNLTTRAEQLRETAKSKNGPATLAMVKDFGRLACGACHTPFRVPPKQ